MKCVVWPHRKHCCQTVYVHLNIRKDKVKLVPFYGKINLLLDISMQNPYSVFQIWCVTDKQALTSHKCYYFLFDVYGGVVSFFVAHLKDSSPERRKKRREKT